MSIASDKAKRDLEMASWAAQRPQNYEEQQWLQDFDPTALGAPQEQAQSDMSNIALDPRLRAAQSDVLTKLQGLGQTGYDDTDRAAIQQAMNETARQEQGQRGAIMQNMQARGMGGSGAELAAQLSNQQGAANRNSMAGAQVAADGRRRALEAMTQGAGLAGNMQNADFSRQAQIAQAKDQINQFNTRNQIQNQQMNNQMMNQAAAMNQQGRQATANNNASGRNDFAQQNFQNQGDIAKVKYNAATNDINAQRAKNASKGNVLQGMASGAAAGSAMGPWGAVGGAAIGGLATAYGNKEKDRAE